MKIVHKNYVLNGPGTAKITPEEDDDLWLVYGLIAAGDTVMADTTRKVSKEAALRSGKAERRKVKLEIIVGSVDDIDYDKEGSVLRISGKNNLENEHVRIGQSHTLELELHDTFVLRKLLWDSQAIKSLERAADPSASADLAVVLMEERLAEIYLVRKSSHITCSRIEASIPRKHSVADYDKALNKFYERVLHDFEEHIDFKVVKCAVIASPGSTKDHFHRHLMLEAERRDVRNIIENKSRIILVHSKEKDTLTKFLNDPIAMKLIKDTKAAPQVQELDHFFAMRNKDEHRTCYGPKHVEVANERMAIERLLITDELVRSADADTRRRYASLIKVVEDSGGTAQVFSVTPHLSGEQLAQLTGVAAILRFPLPDLDDIECDVLR